MSTIAELLVKIGVDVEDADKAEKRVKGLDKTVDRFGDQADRSTRKAQRGFSRLGAGIRNMAVQAKASLSGMVESMGGLKGVALAGATALAALGAATFKFVDGQTAAIDSTNKLAGALGLGVEELQRLQFAAGQSGLSNEHLSAGVRRLNQNLLQMSQGAGGPAADALERLGIGLEDLEGLSRTQQIGLIGERLQGIGDAAQRSATAAQIFGEEAGPKMASMLALGQQGLEQLAASAGNVLTKEDADRASAFQDRMGEVKAMLRQVVQTIAIELLPTVSAAITSFRDWLNENQALIEQYIPAFIREVTQAMGELLTTAKEVGEIIGAIVDLFESLTETLGPAGTELGKVAGQFTRMVNPIRQVSRAVTTLRDLLVSIGAIELKVVNKLEAMAEKNTADLRAKAGYKGSLMAGPGGGGMVTDTLRRSSVATGGGGAPRPRGGGGGGGGRARAGARDEEGLIERWLAAFQNLAEDVQSKLPPATFEDTIKTLLSGQTPDPNFLENIRRLSRTTPSTRDVKPTVAIDFYNFSQTFNIKSTAPQDVGAEVAKATRAEFRKASAKASQGLLSNILR